MPELKFKLTGRALLQAAFGLSPMLLIMLAIGAEPAVRFERTYTPQGTAHLAISNVNGNIKIAAWNKKEIAVRATTTQSVSISDYITGDAITISVKRSLSTGRADFDVSAPANTSISLKNLIGEIVATGLAGHIKVDALEGDIRLISVSPPSVDVKVINGDIFFDGELSGAGPYDLQTMKGDIDVTLPATAGFNLAARALKEKINLGEFPFNFSNQQPKFISGIHSSGGPQLNLTTYHGRILLHKK
jgi:hypothetical protein